MQNPDGSERRLVSNPHSEDRYFDPSYWAELRARFQVPEFSHRDLIDVEELLTQIPLKEIALAARGDRVLIESGGLPERFNKYLNMLIFATGGPPGPVGLQFVARPEMEAGLVHIEGVGDHPGYMDSLIEDEHEVAPGLIHKYQDRVLFVITGQCAAYCRYCTRGRLVGKEGAKTPAEIEESFRYIEQHDEVREVIFSGGDSFVLPRDLFEQVIEAGAWLQENDKIDSIRFGTRLPIHNPLALKDWHYEGLRKLNAPNVMLHINHPAEITKQVVEILDRLRASGAILHSQSVLLRGVNDDREVLIALFRKLQKYGVNPYYVFQCDEVQWAKQFVVPVQEAKELARAVRSEVTGLVGRVRFVIDTAEGHGKIPLEEGYWLSEEVFQDFTGKLFRVTESGLVARLTAPEVLEFLENLDTAQRAKLLR